MEGKRLSDSAGGGGSGVLLSDLLLTMLFYNLVRVDNVEA